MPETLECIHAISRVLPELVSSIKIPIAPEAKVHSRLTVFVRECAAFSEAFSVKQIACGEFAHLFQLILTMFRADEEFDRAFAVIPVVHRD